MAKRGKYKRSIIYMAVTPDKYELPLYVADTVEEIAEKYGLTKKNIYNYVSANRSGRIAGVKFVKVKDDK